MSERFAIWLPAADNEQFAPGVTAGWAGKTLAVRPGDGTSCEGVIVEAEVAEDGAGAYVTLEVPDGTMPAQPLTGYSADG